MSNVEQSRPEESIEARIEEILAEWDDLETAEDTESLSLTSRFAGPVSPMTLARAKRTTSIHRAHVADDATTMSEKMFAQLLAQAECGQNGRGVLVTGPSGGGKSHILDRFRRLKRFRPFESETGEGTVRPLIYVEAPAPCTMKSLGLKIYEEMTGCRLSYLIKEWEVWARVYAQLRAHRTAILMIDEMHHVLIEKTDKDQTKIAETLKTAMQGESNVFLVLGGMPEAATFWREHRQFNRRTRHLKISKLTEDATGFELVANYVDELVPKLGFVQPFSLSEGDLPHRLHVASRGFTGLVACLVKQAAELAVDLGDPTITVEHLADAYEDLFRAHGKANPFLTNDFANLNLPDLEDEGRATRIKGKKRQEPVDEFA